MRFLLTVLTLVLGFFSQIQVVWAADGQLHCPRTVDPPPIPDNFMDLGDNNPNGAADYMFRAILQDDPVNVQDPELGKTYAFFGFQPGTVLENLCNGGAHAYLVLAEWQTEGRFRSNYWDLRIQEDIGEIPYPEACGGAAPLYQIATFRTRPFRDDRALDWMERKFTIQALGKIGFDKDYAVVVSMVTTQARDYFNGFFASKYSYLFNNCGQFVNAMAEFLECEYHISTMACDISGVATKRDVLPESHRRRDSAIAFSA